MTRRTQRERAEEWAAAVATLTSDGSLRLSTLDGRATEISAGMARFTPATVDAVRRVLVATWMRARRAKR